MFSKTRQYLKGQFCSRCSEFANQQPVDTRILGDYIAMPADASEEFLLYRRLYILQNHTPAQAEKMAKEAVDGKKVAVAPIASSPAKHSKVPEKNQRQCEAKADRGTTRKPSSSRSRSQKSKAAPKNKKEKTKKNKTEEKKEKTANTRKRRERSPAPSPTPKARPTNRKASPPRPKTRPKQSRAQWTRMAIAPSTQDQGLRPKAPSAPKNLRKSHPKPPPSPCK